MKAGVNCCRVMNHMLGVLALSTRGKENQCWMNIVYIYMNGMRVLRVVVFK